MHRDDFIMRMFQSAVAMAAKIAGLRTERNKAEIDAMLNEAMKGVSGMSRKTIGLLPPAELESMFSSREDQAERATGLALLLIEEGDSHEVFDESEAAYEDYIRALTLVLPVVLNGSSAVREQLHYTVDGLIERLKNYPSTSGWPLRTVDYFETIHQRYDLAENVLFAIAELAPTPEIFSRGETFYTSRLAESAEALNKGQLPKDEAIDGWKDFQALFKN
ncbi:DUF6483 family protein [Aureibacillus halotolerans]|uniref:Uncharacterized protein n=1 Tax=Aureibacillus halotolerans TaxID=1508390 RepID=A0A4V3D658_9BACI|nr:DUF6483 family protein [Aureibacillus halotolerans]TDQ42697.1 hypothetical protein EV213_101126 [Aureibacillus halotolerans]